MFKTLSPGEDKMIYELEMAIKYGKMLLFENVGDNIPQEFECVMSPEQRMRGKIKMLKFGEKEVEWHENFILYMSTSNPNPKFAPALFLRTSVVNFVVT